MYSDLARNIDSKLFKIVYQPICNCDDGNVIWYESLLRIQNREGDYVSIYPYLQIARSTGLYNQITDFMISKACELLKTFDYNVSVNISTYDIVRNGFIEFVEKQLNKIENMKGTIVFEILESDELIELNKCLEFIAYVRSRGCLVALDDFGSGYSNYSIMLNVPFDIIKLDGSLIKRLERDDKANDLVSSIAFYTKKNNLKTVAEFVDNHKLWENLKKLNIDYVQGYYFGKPNVL